ncbi:MAG: hypothetical protein R3B89_06380 [Polyangiaceae bacterium]
MGTGLVRWALWVSAVVGLIGGCSSSHAEGDANLCQSQWECEGVDMTCACDGRAQPHCVKVGLPGDPCGMHESGPGCIWYAQCLEVKAGQNAASGARAKVSRVTRTTRATPS